MRAEGGDSLLAAAVGRDLKGKLSPVLYVDRDCGWRSCTPWISGLLYVAVALMWLIPDRRIEQHAGNRSD